MMSKSLIELTCSNNLRLLDNIIYRRFIHDESCQTLPSSSDFRTHFPFNRRASSAFAGLALFHKPNGGNPKLWQINSLSVFW